MLDLFKTDQPIAYQVIKNAIANDKLSHAYLLEVNGYSKGLDFAIAISKYILCPNTYSSNDNCNNCPQCKMIDNGNFIELKMINPDGQWIKKEQLEDLQRNFNKKAIVGNKKVYIINGVEKLNASSSNSILKFLEEPSEGIFALLLTENVHQVLNTIVSRCQILSLNAEKKEPDSKTTYDKLVLYTFNNEEEIENFLTNFENKEKLDILIDYINYYEKHGLKTIIYKNKSFIEKFNDKKSIYMGLQWMVLYYKDVLNCKLEKSLTYFNDYKEDIIKVSLMNNMSTICEKIKIIVELSETIKFNANSNMLMDKLVIELTEV